MKRSLALLVAALPALAQYIPPGNGAGGSSGAYTMSSAALSGTVYLPPGGSVAANSTETNVQGVVTVAGTISNLSAKVSTAPGAGTSLVFTFRDNAADTAVTCTIANTATSCTDVAHNFQVAVNDLIDIKVISTGTIASGTYTSGGTITGTSTQTCTVTPTNGGGTGATITVALTGSNTIAGGTALTVTAGGTGFTSAPTSATLGSGTATCSGTAVISTTLTNPAASILVVQWATPGQAGPTGATGAAGTNGTNGANGAVSSLGTNDTNIQLTLSSGILTPVWAGTLAKARIISSAVYNDQSNTWSAGTQDFTGVAHFRPLNGAAASKPATCTTGEVYMATDATAGQNWYFCTATNTWTQQLNSGGTGGTGNAGFNVSVNSGTFTATPTYTCPSATAGTVGMFVVPTLTGNVTSSTLASCTGSSSLSSDLTFVFTQDATGGRTVAMPTGFDSCPVHPAANIRTTCTYTWDGTTGRLAAGPVGTAGYSAGNEVAAPGTPPTGVCFSWFDSTDHQPEAKCNNSATILYMPALATGVKAFLGTPSSANLATAITDETGSGALVFGTSPTLTTPTLGAATATSINKVAFTAPTTAGTIAFGADNSTATLPNGTVPMTVASGTAAMGTGAISSATCATVVTATATGTATTDVVSASFNGDPTAVTGYAPATTGMLTIIAYPTANNVNFKVCNNTSASITPGAITLNWRVTR